MKVAATTKIYLYIAAAILVLIIILSVFFYFKGKKKGSSQTSIQYLPGDLPYGTPNQPGATTGASNSTIKSIAERLHQDMDGFNIWGHDMQPYQDAIILSDTDFVKLYNTYNGLYQSSSGETLTQWIENEKFWENDITDAMLNRLAQLNLR